MKTGFCIGRFDIIHNGHIDLFKNAKKHCDSFIVGVIQDSYKGLRKNLLVFTLEERKEILESIKYIDKVIIFKTEKESKEWIKKNKPDLLITGDEYKDNQPLEKFFKKGNIVYVPGKKNSSSSIKEKIKKSNL